MTKPNIEKVLRLTLYTPEGEFQFHRQTVTDVESLVKDHDLDKQRMMLMGMAGNIFVGWSIFEFVPAEEDRIDELQLRAVALAAGLSVAARAPHEHNMAVLYYAIVRNLTNVKQDGTLQMPDKDGYRAMVEIEHAQEVLKQIYNHALYRRQTVVVPLWRPRGVVAVLEPNGIIQVGVP